MGQATNGTVLRPLRTLFGAGSSAGLTDAQLLERFLGRRDDLAEAAFEALVARHGPMVFGLCRRLLGDRHEAEDAFQATFLVLVRKARSIRVEDSLGGWLYAVTHRIASRARNQIQARRKREAPDVEMLASRHTEDDPLLDARPILHEEIRRLPEKYRAPIVLCYLEELTHEQAARQLGWPVGTVRGRLARAREQLRSRLARRGLTLGTASVGTMLAREATAGVPTVLAEATVRAAFGFAAQGATAGTVPAAAAALTMGVLRTMFLTKLSVATAGVLVVGLLTGGAGLMARSDEPTAKDAPVKAEAPPSVPRGLDQPVSLNFDKAPLGDALKSIAQYTGMNIVPDTAAMAEQDVTLSTPVTLVCKGIRLRSALRYILQPLQLTFRVDEGDVILVTSLPMAEDPGLAALQAELKGLQERLREYQKRVKNPIDPLFQKMRTRIQEKERDLKDYRRRLQKTLEAAVNGLPVIDGQGGSTPAREDLTEYIELAKLRRADLEAGLVQLDANVARAKALLEAPAPSPESPQPEKPLQPKPVLPEPKAVGALPPTGRDSYLDRTRKEVEDQLVGLIKQISVETPRLEKLHRDLLALQELRKLTTGETERPVTVTTEKSSVQRYLEKTGTELEAELAKLQKEFQDQQAKVQTVQHDFKKLREIHILLAGGESQSTSRIRELLREGVKTVLYTVTRPVREVREPNDLERTFEKLAQPKEVGARY